MRKPASDNSNAVSLFPFIAVLLCTMGSLLIILVATTKLARDRAQERARQNVAAAGERPDDSEFRKRISEAQAVLARITEIRTQADREIQDEKLRMSHLEEQTRKLVNQVEDLKAAASELMALDADHFDDRRQAERELKRLRELVSDAAKEVDAVKKEGLGKKRSYAIVPYDGPNGTNRRPIYIECRRDAVIIQPEGIKLNQQDFMPPLDAGSPLAAALRAAREELIRTAPTDADGKPLEPYPLILVRPDGIEAYYAVRRAVAEWDSEFGYEFVDGDWQLSFQPPDPKLAMVEGQAVEHARIRRQALALAAPRAYRSGGGGGYGFGRGEGNGEFGDTVGADYGASEGTSNVSGPRAGSAQPVGGGSPYDKLVIGSEDDGRNAASVTDGQQKESRGAGGGNQSAGSSPTSPKKVAMAQRGASATEQNPSVSGGGSRNVAADNVAQSNTGSRGDNPSSSSAGNSANGPSVAASGASGATANASSVAAASASGGGSPVPSTNGAAGANMTTANVTISPQEVARDLSESRGENWAIEGKGAAAVPVRRSIRVVVRNDRFAILPEGATESTEGGQAIALKDSTSQHVDEIVAAVQQEVRGWGIAGRGLYWRPVLVMQFGPDGESRATELTRLLRNSGIELRPNASIGQREAQPPSRR